MNGTADAAEAAAAVAQQAKPVSEQAQANGQAGEESSGDEGVADAGQEGAGAGSAGKKKKSASCAIIFRSKCIRLGSF